MTCRSTFLLALGCSATAFAAPPAPRPDTPSQVSAWATACMSCHGTDGNAQGTSFMLKGRDPNDLYERLVSFRSGQRHGTVMPDIVQPFTDTELRELAIQFASYK